MNRVISAYKKDPLTSEKEATMRVKQRIKARGKRKRVDKGVEIENEKHHSDPGVRDNP